MKRLWQSWVLFVALVGVAAFAACPAVTPDEKVQTESGTEVVAQDGDSGEKPSEPQRDSAADVAPDAGEPIAEGQKDAGPVEKAPDQAEPPPERGVEKKTPDATSNGKTLEVPSQGGKICYKHICIDIPGAATPDKDVSVKIKEAVQPPRGSLVPPMDVGPDNWKPTGKANMIVEFNYSQFPAAQAVAPSQLRVAFVDNGRWVFVKTVVDAQAKIARGETPHLSVWGLVVSGKSCGRTADCHDTEVCKGSLVCEPQPCQSKSDCIGNDICVGGKCAVCIPSPEICDGKDNNCDGQIDEGVTKSCYAGPAGTEGVGQCKAGTQKCVSGTWGACTGEIVPTTEVCDQKDNDCNGRTDEPCKSCRSSADCTSTSMKCPNGICIEECPSGQTLCVDGCVDLQKETKHCGRCERVCSSGQACVAGVCR